jgi:exosortase/archaeosortase family protein
MSRPIRRESPQPAAASPSATPPPAIRSRAALLFTAALYVVVVLALVSILHARVVERVLLGPFRTAVATGTADTLNVLGLAAAHHGNQITSQNLSVVIVNECTGLEAVILLVAAILVFPAGWRAKGVGILASLGVMAILNFLRVVSLCYLGTYSATLLTIGHLYVWPVTVIVTGLAMLLFWAEHVGGARG